MGPATVSPPPPAWRPGSPPGQAAETTHEQLRCGSLEVVSPGPRGRPDRSPVEDAASPGVVPRSRLLLARVGRPLPPGPGISSESSPASSWCLAFIKRRTLTLVSSIYTVYTN